MAKQVKLESRHIREGSLATTLALLMVGTIVLIMLGFGLFARGTIRDAVKLQILTAAHEDAFIAAQADMAAWGQYFDTPFQGKSPNEVKTLAAAMKPLDYDKTFHDPAFIHATVWNEERFVRFVRSDARIVAAELLSADTPPILLRQSWTGDLAFNATYGAEPVKFDGGDAVEGYLKLEGHDRHVIRGSHAILNREGVRLGSFGVYLDAAAVDDATTALMEHFIALALAFVGLSIAVAWYAGKRVTRPLTALQEDMRIVASGDFEHRTKAHSHDEVGALARSFDTLTQSLAEARRAERAAAASVHQLAVAGEVTTNLFPAKLPAIDGFQLAAHHEGSGSLGGEYYDVLPLPDGRWALAVGAASGRGLPAAMVMTMARSFLTAVARTESDPGKMLRDVNALLSADLRRGMYVTVLLAVLDPAAATLTVANAGHSPLLLWRGAGGGSLAPVHSEGIALGFDKGPVFDRTLKVVRLSLKPGDHVVLYTPGVTRVANAAGEGLGEERFGGLVRREGGHPAGVFVRRMAALVKKFRGEQPLAEDVTLLSLVRLPDHEDGT